MPTLCVTSYDRFRGVDLSTDPALVDTSRSPSAPNLISDAGGYPEKRPGWRTVYRIPDGARVNGLHRLPLASGGDVRIVHAGTKLYRVDGDTLTMLADNVNDDRSTSFVQGGKLWILTGGEYLVFDGTTLQPVGEIAYAPLTTVSALPAGGGMTLEPVNLLTPTRRNSFLADGIATAYHLDTAPIASVDAVTVNGSPVTAYTADTAAGIVTFSAAPAAPVITGEDNVVITFSVSDESREPVIEQCRFAAGFGFGGDTGERIFFSGNPAHPNADWHCEIHRPDLLPDPAYVPDTSFALVGSDANPILGYRRIGERLAILKAENDQDATVFFRDSGLDGENNAVFPLSQGVAGAGAVSPWSIANLGDEGLFLSRHGVYAVATQAYTSHYCLQNRSYFVDSRLTGEPHLEEAAAVQWNGLYLLALNNVCYVLDGRQDRSYKPQSMGDFVYECWYWTNIPARCWLEAEGLLWFGTSDGRVCVFRSDEVRMNRYSDDDAPISASWATRADDDGCFARLKSIPLRGSAVMIKPNTRSSVRVTVRTERDFGVDVHTASTNILDFSDLDFEHFTFETGDTPQIIPLNRKIKRYKTCQIIVANDEVNEGFGVYGIVKRFVRGRAARI